MFAAAADLMYIALRDVNESPNLGLLSCIQESQRDGRGCLPYYLGMTPLDYVNLGQVTGVGGERWYQFDAAVFEQSELRQELLEMRRDEWSELRALLLANRAEDNVITSLLADIVAAGCLGGDHLWRDLGFNNRAQLGDLMKINFRPLFLANHADMKWKKFFYKQLCEQEGGYVCRSPTCEQCAAYDDCFGPEI